MNVAPSGGWPGSGRREAPIGWHGQASPATGHRWSRCTSGFTRAGARTASLPVAAYRRPAKADTGRRDGFRGCAPRRRSQCGPRGCGERAPGCCADNRSACQDEFQADDRPLLRVLRAAIMAAYRDACAPCREVRCSSGGPPGCRPERACGPACKPAERAPSQCGGKTDCGEARATCDGRRQTTCCSNRPACAGGTPAAN